MKKFKVLVLVLAAAMLVGILAGCSTSASDIHVTLVLTDAEDNEIFNQEIAVNGDAPTVEQVINEAANVYYDFIECKWDNRFALSVKDKIKDADYPDTLDCGWLFYMNGEEATAKANQTSVKDGDVIQYKYTKFESEDTEEVADGTDTVSDDAGTEGTEEA